jgi:hypothetical protein
MHSNGVRVLCVKKKIIKYNYEYFFFFKFILNFLFLKIFIFFLVDDLYD